MKSNSMKRRINVEKDAKQTLVAWVLDETGSMQGIAGQTVSGFNEFLATLKTKPGNFWVQLTRFNDAAIKIRTAEPLEKTENLTDYQPNYNTPLYDAIGDAIDQALLWTSTDRHRGVMLVVQTDGQENASKRRTRDHVVEMIAALRKAGGEIIFLGVDIDLWHKEGLAQAANIGTMSIPSAKTGSTMTAMASTMDTYHRGGAQHVNSSMPAFAASVGATYDVDDQDKVTPGITGMVPPKKTKKKP